MKIRFLLILLFINLGIYQFSKADQQTQFANRVSIYKGPWNNLTPVLGVTHYTIKNIPKSFQMALQIVNFDAGVASVNLSNMYCSVDPNIVDYDTASNKGKFTNISFSSNGVTAISTLVSLVGGQTFNSGNTITTPTLPCSSVTLEFSSASQLATNVEIVAIFSELVLGQTSTSGGLGAGSTTGGYVQGISPTASNGFATFPLVDGALQPSINASTAGMGVDTFAGTQGSLAGGLTGNVLVGTPPNPSSSSDWGFVFYTGFPAVGGTGLLAPWTCVVAANGCGGTSSNGLPDIAQLSGYSIQSKVFTALINTSGATNTFTEFVSFNKTGVIRQQINNASGPAATLAGSVQVIVPVCIIAPCIINSVTDTQGNLWTKVIDRNALAGSGNYGGLSVWIASSVAGANTVTVTPQAGSVVTTSAYLELTGITPANLNRPLVPISSSNNTLRASETDPGGIFTNTGGFTYQQIVTLSAAATSTVSLWDVSQHGVFRSCAVSDRVTAIAGTTPSLLWWLQDSVDGVAFNDRLASPSITTTSNHYGSVAGGGTNPAATTDGALAVATRVDGPLMPFGRLKFTLAGTGPSTTFTIGVACE